MSRGGVVLGLTLLAAAGCATWPFSWPASPMLVRADALAREGDYRGAVVVYDEFLARYADDPRAPRALETRDTLAAIVIARGELARLREEVTRLHEELARREGDLARVRQELGARQAEAEQLRADLEKLKQLDMQMERRRPR